MEKYIFIGGKILTITETKESSKKSSSNEGQPGGVSRNPANRQRKEKIRKKKQLGIKISREEAAIGPSKELKMRPCLGHEGNDLNRLLGAASCARWPSLTPLDT